VTDLARADGLAGGYTILHAIESLPADAGFERRWQALRWTPGAGRAALQEMPVPIGPRSLLTLSAAHRTATLVSESGRDPVDDAFKIRTHFLTDEPPVTLEGDLTSAYRLLQPALAYSVEDQQFHRVGPRLAPLGAPLPLAPGGPPTGAYHVVGRR
jgi:hypothetical protein